MIHPKNRVTPSGNFQFCHAIPITYWAPVQEVFSFLSCKSESGYSVGARHCLGIPQNLRVDDWLIGSCAFRVGPEILGTQFTPQLQIPISIQSYASYSVCNWFGIIVWPSSLDGKPNVSQPGQQRQVIASIRTPRCKHSQGWAVRRTSLANAVRKTRSFGSILKGFEDDWLTLHLRRPPTVIRRLLGYSCWSPTVEMMRSTEDVSIVTIKRRS